MFDIQDKNIKYVDINTKPIPIDDSKFIDIKKQEIKPVCKRAYCKDCGTEIKFSGKCYYSNPAKYEHECPKCNKTYQLGISYPYIDFE